MERRGVTEGIPPSPVRRYQFAGGEIDILARYAQFVPGSPDRVFLFAAHEVTVKDVEITPPSQRSDDSPYSDMHAYYAGDGADVIVYFLREWADDAATDFVGCSLIWELHELSHWAAPVDDNEQGPDHWERWNRVLTDVAGYVLEIEEWDVDEYDPPENTREQTSPTTEQATLEDITTS